MVTPTRRIRPQTVAESLERKVLAHLVRIHSQRVEARTRYLDVYA